MAYVLFCFLVSKVNSNRAGEGLTTSVSGRIYHSVVYPWMNNSFNVVRVCVLRPNVKSDTMGIYIP